MSKPQDNSAALRHLVYADLLSALPPASYSQAETMIVNLGIHRTVGKRRAMSRLLWLKTTPDLFGQDQDIGRRKIETELAGKYGSRLASIAGFYFMQNRWRLNLPTRCLLFGYAGRHGFYNGILCQPIDTIDTYFLLSSARFDGPKAIRLEEKDRLYFGSYKEPVTAPAATAELRQNTAPAGI